jgi:hypothetical protein
MNGLYGLIGDSDGRNIRKCDCRAVSAVAGAGCAACMEVREMNKLLWFIVLVTLAVTTLQAVQLVEVCKQNIALAIKMDGLEDRMNYQMQLIDKLQKQQQRAKTTSDLLHRGGCGKIEYSHPIYRIPENK